MKHISFVSQQEFSYMGTTYSFLVNTRPAGWGIQGHDVKVDIPEGTGKFMIGALINKALADRTKPSMKRRVPWSF